MTTLCDGANHEPPCTDRATVTVHWQAPDYQNESVYCLTHARQPVLDLLDAVRAEGGVLTVSTVEP